MKDGEAYLSVKGYIQTRNIGYINAGFYMEVSRARDGA